MGDAYDNGVMESIIGLFKAECIATTVFHDGPYKTLADVEYAVAASVDWYNHRRPHGTPGYNTPDEHEQAYYAADDASLCAASEFIDRSDGLPGLEKAHGFDLPKGSLTEVDLGIVFTRVPKRSPYNFGEVFATDGRTRQTTWSSSTTTSLSSSSTTSP